MANKNEVLGALRKAGRIGLLIVQEILSSIIVSHVQKITKIINEAKCSL